MTARILPIALVLAGCSRPADPPTTPIPAPASVPADESLSFGRELLLRRGDVLYSGNLVRPLPAGTKVRITGPVQDDGRIDVLVLDPPHAGMAGSVESDSFDPE